MRGTQLQLCLLPSISLAEKSKAIKIFIPEQKQVGTRSVPHCHIGEGLSQGRGAVCVCRGHRRSRRVEVTLPGVGFRERKNFLFTRPALRMRDF